jgi:hypothetical protein
MTQMCHAAVDRATRFTRVRFLNRSILIGLLASVIAATSATATTTPTKANWATAANASCRVANAQVRKLPRITTAKLLLADIRATGRISVQLTAKLAAIPRPSSERVMIASLLTNYRTATRLIVEQLVPALERGDQALASRLVDKLDKLDPQGNRLALALGARVCAQNPEPSG